MERSSATPQPRCTLLKTPGGNAVGCLCGSIYESISKRPELESAVLRQAQDERVRQLGPLMVSLSNHRLQRQPFDGSRTNGRMSTEPDIF